MKRIFVAVDISDEARRRVSKYVDLLRNEFRPVRVGWERAEKLHLTLKFLGETSREQATALERIGAEISRKVAGFKLQIRETGVFPNLGNPRVLWIDVRDEAQNLKKINELLESETEKLGFARERRAFVPHLTIGRVREPHSARALAKKHLENRFEPVEFAVSEIVIYESKLLPSGSIYSVVSKHGFDRE